MSKLSILKCYHASRDQCNVILQHLLSWYVTKYLSEKKLAPILYCDFSLTLWPYKPLHNPCLSISSFDIIFQIYEGLYLASAIHDSRLFAIIQGWIMLSLFAALRNAHVSYLCRATPGPPACRLYIRINLWLSSFKYEICCYFYDYLYYIDDMRVINIYLYSSICPSAP